MRKLCVRIASNGCALAATAAVLIAVGACGGAGSGEARAPEGVAGKPKHHVVVVSIDGLRPDAITDADKHGLRIPRLRALHREGAHAQGVVGTWPTVTYPAHTTLVTGAPPNVHGILSNHPFDPYGKNQDGWYWYARDIRVPTLWDAAAKAGLSTGASYWPVTVGANITWNFPQFWRAKNDEDDKLLAALATPGLADEARGKGFALPTEHRSDASRADGAVFLLRHRRPALTLAYLTDLDTVSHRAGPFSPDANRTLEEIDTQLGRIIDAARESFAADASIVVVSDHGFLPIHATVQPNAMLATAGLLDATGNVVSRYRVVADPAGGSCGIVIDPAALANDPSIASRVETLFSLATKDSASGIVRVHRGDDVHLAGGFAHAAMVLEAADGFAFGGGVEGGPVVPSADRGAHGYPPTRTEMRATLLLAGAGVRGGHDVGVVPMEDVAPTIARLLGVTLPAAKGKALDAALTP